MKKFFVSVTKLISDTMVFFYAVARGRNPGIYNNWEACKVEIYKYPNPIFRKFPSKSEAEEFIASRGSSSGVKSTNEICAKNTFSKKTAKTRLNTSAEIGTSPYDRMEKRLKDWAKDRISLSQFDVESEAVKIADELGIKNFNQNGGWLKYHIECNPGIYKLLRLQRDNEKCENLVKEEDKNILEKLSTLESRISGLSNSGLTIPARVKILERNLLSMHKDLNEIKRHLWTDTHQADSTLKDNRKRKRSEESTDKEKETVDNLLFNKKSLDVLSNFQTDGQGFVNVYTDGACSGNGKLGATAGIGVWFGDEHPLNISRPIENGYRATNNLAEIQAVTEAAKQATQAGIKKLKIHTDSQFLISCITQWMPKWKKNGWRKADGEHVINKTELIEMEKALKPLTIAWNHVRGHAGIHGNEMADKLARAGAAEQNKN